MRTESPNRALASPARLLEMLTDRFGAFEAIAMASIKLARHVPEDELSMDLLVAEAVLEFGDDLRQASETMAKWAGGEGWAPPQRTGARAGTSACPPGMSEARTGAHSPRIVWR